MSGSCATTLNHCPLADELEPYFRSGNDVPVERATIPTELALRVIQELRRFNYVLENDVDDLFQYGGDADEIRDGIDYVMKVGECRCDDKEPTPMEEETRVCETCRKPIIV